MSPERPFQRDLSSAIEERRFEVGAPDDGRRLDAFLAARMAWRSRSRIQSLIAGARVSVAAPKAALPRAGSPAAPVRSSTRVRAGDLVLVRLDSAFVDAGHGDAGIAGAERARGGEALAVAPEIVILHEDEHLLAVEKPAQMNVYPTRRHLGGSLTELLHRRHRGLGLPGAPPSPCHRLDRETSGVVLYAKDRGTRAAIGRQFEDRTVEKTYLALVAGLPRGDEGSIDLPLGRDLASRVEIRQGVRRDGAGQPALTRWRVRARYPAGAGTPASRASTWSAGCALLELRPETGRQHQLRAHLAAIGHPILGDKLYLGGDELFLASLERALRAEEVAALGGSERLALHAWRLALRHPATGERLEIVSGTGTSFGK